MSIVLTTLNARYSHAALGLRYLQANMGELQGLTRIVEFVVGVDPSVVVERLLAMRPRIVGFGVYIWNVAETTKVVAMLKRVAPAVTIVLGGPEVSHETAEQEIVRRADHVITGWGEVSLPRLCRHILAGLQPMKVQAGEQAPLGQLQLPYRHYSDHDLAHRSLYVEASRGCAFQCEFCLSALDKTAWPIDTDLFLMEMDGLYARGARQFRFVDRTFNLNVRTSLKILQFFLDKLEARPEHTLFLHFELVPDLLPDALMQSIARFPRGSLQLEIGLQTLNPDVQALISRKQDTDISLHNVGWLRENTQAHLHVDLIAGLPGEDTASFARGFDRVCALRPQEIQIGILKRLRGAPIIRHTEEFGLVFDAAPPYRILATKHIDFPSMQRLVRFARYWDLVANSGRFAASLPALLGDAPFANFMAWSDWLYAKTGATCAIARDRLAEYLAQWLESNGLADAAATASRSDDCAGRAQGGPLKPESGAPGSMRTDGPPRQRRHRT